MTKEFKIDVGTGFEFPFDIIMREIKARETPSETRRVLAAMRNAYSGPSGSHFLVARDH